MKKFKICIMLWAMCLLTACGKEKPIETYEYSNNEILSIAITKTSVYSDRIELNFSEDSISSVKNVVCYANDFSVLEEKAEYKLEDNSFTIYSENASQISGLRIDVNSNMYLEIRYLDSDRYAMIVNSWADDLGYEANGDLDTYYTDEEKQKKEEIKKEHEAYEEKCFSLVEGTWEDEDGLVRIEFCHKEEGRKVFVYNNIEGSWELTREFMAYNVSANEEADSVSVYIDDAIGYSCRYEFVLYNDNTEVETEFADGRLKKIDSLYN